MRKDNEVGDVFEVVGNFGLVEIGSIMVLMPGGDYADVKDLQRGLTQTWGMRGGDGMKRIYPALPAESDIETINLMGKDYPKAEIEAALKDILPV